MSQTPAGLVVNTHELWEFHNMSYMWEKSIVIKLSHP